MTPAPRTAAGRALLDLYIADAEVPQLDWLRMGQGILAIEAEAASAGSDHECRATEQCRQYASEEVSEALAGDDW